MPTLYSVDARLSGCCNPFEPRIEANEFICGYVGIPSTFIYVYLLFLLLFFFQAVCITRIVYVYIKWKCECVWQFVVMYSMQPYKDEWHSISRMSSETLDEMRPTLDLPDCPSDFQEFTECFLFMSNGTNKKFTCSYN